MVTAYSSLGRTKVLYATSLVLLGAKAKFLRRKPSVLSLVHMHNIHPGAIIHTGCKFAHGVYFGHINGVL